jgi:hypothetical protein
METDDESDAESEVSNTYRWKKDDFDYDEVLGDQTEGMRTSY